MTVGFASADVTSAEVTGGAGGRVPVGFWSTEAQRYRGAVVRVPVGFGCRKAAGMSWGHPCAGGTLLGGGGEDGGDGGVCRWDLLLRMQPAPR